MKGYSCEIPERCARARLEDVNASYKDLSEVCGVVRNKKTDWAIEFLDKASRGEVPVLFRRHNTKFGHRRELGGRKGRYPQKAAGLVLKAIKSAIANGKSDRPGRPVRDRGDLREQEADLSLGWPPRAGRPAHTWSHPGSR